MFPKVILISLAIGTLSVNALSILVTRGPTPEPNCEFPRSFPAIFYHDLTFLREQSEMSKPETSLSPNVKF